MRRAFGCARNPGRGVTISSCRLPRYRLLVARATHCRLEVRATLAARASRMVGACGMIRGRSLTPAGRRAPLHAVRRSPDWSMGPPCSGRPPLSDLLSPDRAQQLQRHDLEPNDQRFTI
jgi:hypothetical protein